MSSPALDDDAIDDILYLARTNEAAELAALLAQLSTPHQRSKAELVAVAVDPHSRNTALHYAAANGHVDTIRFLFSLEADKASAPASGLINAVNDAGNTALHWAALNGRLDCVKLLVESGADVTIINKAGHDAVFEAEINDKGDIVEWLLGAVEELEKGIGQPGASSTTAGELGADLEGELDDAAGGVDDPSAAAVDQVRRQMGRLETRDASKDG